MKKTSYLFALMVATVLSLGFASCGDDDADDYADEYESGRNNGGNGGNGGQQTVYFEEPFISWGTYASSVKTTMKSHGYTFWKEDSSNGNLKYYFHGKYLEDQSYYLFTSRRLYRIYFLFEVEKATIQNIKQYLGSTLGYTDLGEDNFNDGTRFYLYETPNKKSWAFVYSGKFSDGSGMTAVLYVDPTSLNSSARQNDIDDDITRGAGLGLAKPNIVVDKR